MSSYYQVPAFLSPGDAILLTAPARYVTREQVEKAVAVIEAAGFVAEVPSQLTVQWGQFGGDDDHRADQLNAAFRNPRIRAIWAMRGGYGCARVLPKLDAEAFRMDPKWIIGFSDVTALHGWVQHQGIASLHAPVTNTFPGMPLEEQQTMWEALQRAQKAPNAPVVGGNLSVLYSLLGTPYFPPTEGAWLLLEDLDEFLYHVDRMLLALRLSGALDKVRGVLMGSFSDLKDNTRAHGQSVDNPYGMTLRDMIAQHVPEGTPVVWDVPVGHGSTNAPVLLGTGSANVAHWTEGI